MTNAMPLVGCGLALAVLFPSAAQATEDMGTNNSDVFTTWEAEGNWSGDVPDPRSTTTTDLADPVQVDFGTLTTYQKIQGWDLKGKPNKYIHLDKLVSAGAPREIQLPKDSLGTRGIALFLRDVDDFNGYFTVDPKSGSSGTSPGATVAFRATESYTPYLQYLSGAFPFAYCVPTVGKVQIGHVLGGGRFRLNDGTNQGSIELVTSPGGETSPYLNAGTLILHGATNDAETVLAGAALHLDASAAGTLTMDGNYVSGWTDPVSGITVVPEQSGGNRPTVTNVFAKTLPAVNFGRFSGVVQYGNNCLTNKGNYTTWAGYSSRFRLPQPLTGVKEMFVVWRDWYRAQNASYFVGTDVAADNVFHRIQSGNGLFATTAATTQIQQGETRLNGQQVLTGQGVMSYDDVYVASAGVGSGCAGGKVEYIGGGMGLFATEMPNRGGLAIGEIILFTKTLTSGERRAVNAYLQKKWLSGRAAADLDLGTLTAADGTTVEVAEGTSEIAELDMAVGTTLVKTGAGDLVIGQLTRDNMTFDVRAGRVVLKRDAKPLDVDVATYRPPADAYLWLDATKSDSLVKDGSGNVSKWNDVRNGKNEGGTFACADPTVDKNKARVGVDATIVDGASPSGLPVFDTGTVGDATTAAAFTLKVNNNEIGRDLQEIFVVARHKGEGVIFGGSYLDLNGMAADKILADSYASRYSEAGVVTLNGVTVNPTACVNAPTSFQVFSIAASGGIAWNGLSHDRGGSAGGCQYGEVIVYSRRLTADERREVTAYLMKKWLDKDHPDTLASRSTAVLAITAGKTETVTLDAEGSPVISRTTDAAGALLAKAWAHYDATKVDNFTFDTGSSTRLKVWYDDNKEGDRAMINYTQAQMPSRSNVVINAGKTMPVVDFGPAYVSSDKSYACNLKMNTAQCNNDVSEIYLIHADNDASGTTGLFGVDRGSVTDAMGKYLWKRDGRKILASSSTAIVNGVIRVDGQSSSRTFEPAVGTYHLYTFIPTIPVSATDFAHTFYGGSERHSGGACYGEVLFYKGDNTNAPPDQANVEAYLMKKWFNQGRGPKCNLGALVLTGERLAYDDAVGGADYVLPSLSGVGAINFGANPVSDLATLAPTDILSVKAASTAFASNLSLDIAFKSKDAWSRVELDGTVALPPQATVSVTVPDNVRPDKKRSYPILTATAVTGDISSWKLNLTCARHPSARLVRKADGVYLEFLPLGMMILIR